MCQQWPALLVNIENSHQDVGNLPQWHYTPHFQKHHNLKIGKVDFFVTPPHPFHLESFHKLYRFFVRRSFISSGLTISWILQSSNLFTVTFLLDSSLTLTHPIPKWEILTSKNDLWIHFMQHSNIGMSTGSLKCVYNIISLKCYIMSKNYHFLTSMWEIYERSRRPAQFENEWNV